MVLFERDVRHFDKTGVKFNGSMTFGSFGRSDQVTDMRAGNADFYIQAAGTHAHSDNYKDGDGTKVHSHYTRWNINGRLDGRRMRIRFSNSL